MGGGLFGGLFGISDVILDGAQLFRAIGFPDMRENAVGGGACLFW
ncbi:hypothetical protein [uncultured Victivallis sp.]|nr:hypothetical protein [uncultured Victivallis sp.]